MKPAFSAALQAMALCMGSLFSTPAAAYGKCELWQDGGYPRSATFDLPPSVVLPADRHDWTEDTAGAASKNILARARIEPLSDGNFPSFPGEDSTSKPYLFCDSVGGNWTTEVLLEGLGAPIPGSDPPIYPSGVDGVGIQARMGAVSNWLPYRKNAQATSGTIAGLGAFYWSVEWFRLELVATNKSPHQGGSDLGMTKPATVTYTVKQNGAGPDLRVLNLLIPPIRIIRGSCTVPDTEVQMGRVPLAAFAASDAPQEAAKDFQVNLNCSGAMKMAYSFYSNDMSRADQGIIALQDTPISARNVGLQIQDESGTPLNLLGWQAPVTTTAGSFPLKFRAQYRRLQSGAISPGLANATATITMEYR